MRRSQALAILSALLLLAATFFAGAACASAAQRRRNTVAQAINTYKAAKAVYDRACQVRPHLRDDCDPFFLELQAAHAAIQAAAPSTRSAAPIQIPAVEATEKALLKRVG